MSKTITQERLNGLATLLLSKPNTKLDMRESRGCLAGHLGNGNYGDGVRLMLRMLDVKTEKKLRKALLKSGVGHDVKDWDWIHGMQKSHPCGNNAGFWTGKPHKNKVWSHDVARMLLQGFSEEKEECVTGFPRITNQPMGDITIINHETGERATAKVMVPA